MRVLLLNLPWVKCGRLGVRAGSRWPFTSVPEKDGRIHYIPFPFFLAYATALLKREGKDARLIDAVAQGLGEQRATEEILSHEPALLVVETSTPSFGNDIRLIHDFRKKAPSCRIALCGPHVGVFVEQVLHAHDAVDYVLFGEYEYTLLDLVNQLEHKCDFSSVVGLAYRENGVIKVNGPRSIIENLDDLPWPERETLPMYRYNDGFAGLPLPNVQMWTSRGCPFKCTFCLWPKTMYRGHRWRTRSPRDVVNEMEYLVKKYDFKAVYFDDDVFNIERARVIEMCRQIKSRRMNIPWAVMARVDLMDEEILGIMSEAGLRAIKYGIESADETIVSRCKKNLDLAKARQIIRATKESGVKAHLSFCLGLPYETRQSAETTIDFIRETRPDSYQVSFAVPFPGTELFVDMKRENLLLSEEWAEYDGNCKCIIRSPSLSSDDLERIKSAIGNNCNAQ